MDIQAAWNQFLSTIRGYNLIEHLNRGCDIEGIHDLEEVMGITFPSDLRDLYLMNNGQRYNKTGIFKAVSGYSKYSKPIFLSLKQVFIVWQNLRKKKLDVFNDSLIPFASSGEGDSVDDVFCIDSITHEIYLLWVLAADWTLPVEWQTAKFKRGSSLSEFILGQIQLY